MNQKQTALNLTRPDDKMVYNQVKSQVFLCLRDHEQKFSDFLYAAKAQEIVNLLMQEHKGVAFYTWGGFDELERVRIGLCSFGQLTNEAFPIQPIQINFDKFAGKIAHREILGAVLGLGIDRGKVGDILIFSQTAVIFLDQDMAAYVMGSISKIGKNKITVTIPDMDMVFVPMIDDKSVNIKLDNPRLSSLLAKSFNLGRDHCLSLIKAKKVMINWAVVTKDTTSLVAGQTISVRGQGKLVINTIDNHKFSVSVYR